MREVVLDTETTGLDPANGDRIVEIGCVELINHIATGATWHTYLCPQRDMPSEAEAVHGLTTAFLRDKPVFTAVCDDFLQFIADSPLVIHNAPFDVGFLNAELDRAGKPKLSPDRVLDTLAMARRKNPAGPNSLDALCRRYGVDNTDRTLHGALLDARLLAEVYLELIGGRQVALALDPERQEQTITPTDIQPSPARQRQEPLAPRLTQAERDAHRKFVAELGDEPIWARYRE